MSLLTLGVGKTVAAGASLSIVTTTATSANNVTTPSLSGVTAGALMVLSCASADDAASATDVNITGTTLTWTKRAETVTDGVHSYGTTEIWTAPCPAGGTVSPTCTWQGGTTNASSSVLYAVTGQEAVLGGANNNGLNQSAPSVALTTTRANSVIFCVSSDWAARDPSGRVYRDVPITETLLHNLSTTIYVGYHYYKTTTSIATYTEGLSSPSTMQAGSAVYEIRTP